MSKILIVEDQGLQAKDLSEELAALGYTVPEPARKAVEAVEAVREHIPDLVLMDIMLAGKPDGITTAQIIYDLYDVPVVFLTSETDSTDRLRNTVAFGYIHKPVQDPNVLKHTIELALHSYRRHSDTTSEMSMSFDPACKILSVNQLGLRILGYSLPDLRGVDILNLIAPEDTDRARQRFQAQFEGRETRRYELTFITKERNKVILELQPRPVALLTDRLGVKLIANDITLRKQLEQEYVAREKKAAIGALGRVVAHQIRSKLTPIKGYLELLTSQKEEQKKVETIDIMLLAIIRATDLASELMMLGERLPATLVSLDLVRYVPSIKGLLARLLGAHNIVTLNIATDSPPVWADPTMLRHALLNLAIEARQLASEGREWTIEIKGEDITGDYVLKYPDAHKGRHVAITMAPSGINLAPFAHLDGSFDSIFAIDRFGKSTGLCLYAVREIVMSHGGWVQTLGSTNSVEGFRFFLRPSNLPADPIETFYSPLGRESILVIDEEPEIGPVVKALLDPLGYKLRIVSSVDHAKSAFTETGAQCDLILASIYLHEGFGVDLIPWIKKRKPNIRVAYSSSKEENEIWKMGEDAGVGLKGRIDYIARPYDQQSLAKVVRRVLDVPLAK